MRFIILTTLLTLIGFQAMAQGIEFFHGTWDEALAKAKEEEKIIFVDAYTTWCGPCKRMAKNVFTLPEVGAFYNDNFINMKIDMEKPAGRAFQTKYPVSAYPTFYYIDEKGKTVLTTKGGRKPNDFIALGKNAVGKVDRSLDFVEAYEKGDRDPELVYNYVKALNKSGKPSLKISNEYIKNQKDLTTPQNLKFISEAAVQADSRIFGLLIKHRSAIEQVTSKEEVAEKIETACNATLNKAIEYSSEDLFKEAKEKMKANLPNQAKTFGMIADMKYYSGVNEQEKYMKACNTYAKKGIAKDAQKLDALAKSMFETFKTNKDILSASEKIAGKAAKIGKSSTYYINYAQILIKNGKKKEAKAAVQKGIKLAGNDQRQKAMAEQLLQRIENS